MRSIALEQIYNDVVTWQKSGDYVGRCARGCSVFVAILHGSEGTQQGPGIVFVSLHYVVGRQVSPSVECALRRLVSYDTLIITLG